MNKAICVNSQQDNMYIFDEFTKLNLMDVDLNMKWKT